MKAESAVSVSQSRKSWKRSKVQTRRVLQECRRLEVWNQAVGQRGSGGIKNERAVEVRGAAWVRARSNDEDDQLEHERIARLVNPALGGAVGNIGGQKALEHICGQQRVGILRECEERRR